MNQRKGRAISEILDPQIFPKEANGSWKCIVPAGLSPLKNISFLILVFQKFCGRIEQRGGEEIAKVT